MQNVLLAFPFRISITELATQMESLFNAIQDIDIITGLPDQIILHKMVDKKDDYVTLREYINLKEGENWLEWFEDEDYELVMSMESFIEFRFRNLDTARECLIHLATLFPAMVIELDDYHITSKEFLSRLEREPEWDWRDYEWNPWLNYNWGSR
jgi:hypothetical protein